MAKATRRVFTAGFTMCLLLALLLPPPVLAHTGNHHNGAQTSARYDGAYAWIETPNPGVRANTNDFIASRILLKKDSAGSQWIEVGWAEVGWHGLVNGVPEQFVYVYDTVHRAWHFYDALCVGTGCHVDVRAHPSTNCDIGDPSCVWNAQIWNHSLGVWEQLHAVTLPMDRAYVEEFTEVSIDPNNPTSTHLQVDLDFNDLDWFLTQRKFADGTWRDWDSNTSKQAVAPYCIEWINNYYRFEAQNGGC